ncbi:hypothetical protein [Pseudomonas sp. EL_65y_Pfl1_R32]|uniref:hypothetical protein n=1 Tax=Pseudomonas sp. EL_65y_Pfl1_R32 TaxID=3088696 RepID=UPI0030DBFEE7
MDDENIKYERRVVCFFDILGWKQHIDDAGNDPQKISRLTLLPKIFASDAIKAMDGKNQRLTSFSDCVVVSCLETEVNLSNFIFGLSKIFLAAASEGFFLRAGVTIDDIYHDKDMVFGPALNRAYILESTGDYPRIILDDKVSKLREVDGCKQDGEKLYIDPYECALLNGSIPRELVIEALSRINFNASHLIKSLRAKPVPPPLEPKAKSSSPVEKIEWVELRTRRLINGVLNQTS